MSSTLNYDGPGGFSYGDESNDTASDGSDRDGGNHVFLFVGSIGFIIVLCVMPLIARKLKCFETARLRRLQEYMDEQAAKAKEDLEKRQVAIEACLTSKVVPPCSSSEESNYITATDAHLECAEKGVASKAESSETAIVEADIEESNSTDTDFAIVALEQGDEKEHDNNHDDDDCHICLEPFEPGDYKTFTVISQCQHAFHRTCIVEWLQEHDDCPCCRAKFIVLEPEGKKEAPDV